MDLSKQRLEAGMMLFVAATPLRRIYGTNLMASCIPLHEQTQRRTHLVLFSSETGTTKHPLGIPRTAVSTLGVVMHTTGNVLHVRLSDSFEKGATIARTLLGEDMPCS